MSISPLYVEELQNMPSEEEKQRFRITDLASLTWAMRKLAAIEAKKAEVNAVADQEIERIEKYRQSELDKLAGSEEFFKSLISEYATRRREEDPKFKSEKTPYGSIGFRKQPPRWHYNDDELIAYLEQNEYTDLIRVKKEPAKTEIKKLFQPLADGRVIDTNGQEVAGITVEHLPETLTVKVGD